MFIALTFHLYVCCFFFISAAPDEIFNTGIRYRADNDPRKVDVGVGAYRTDEGKPLVLNSVKKAEQLVLKDVSLNKEYLAIDGDAKFVKLARELLFGSNSQAIKENRIATLQGISGTGSLRVATDFIWQFLPRGTAIYYSKPTWGNHLSIFQHTGAGLTAKPYRYWDAKGRKIDLDGLLEDLRNAPERSVILLHACAHNPTGMDPTREQWKKIAEVIKSRNHLPFFDSAYQGFASGDLDADAWAVRYFVEQGFELIASQSFAKNFGLYNERVGTVSFVARDAKTAAAVLSQAKIVVRANYSNPPSHGARVAATILSNPELKAEWIAELKGMANRINEMRKALRGELERLKTPGDWSHVTTQIGMFSFLGVSPAAAKHIVDKWHVYMLSNSRISIAGLNSKNVKYVAAAIHDAVVNIKE
jgi:aspartate aminotransferase